MNEVTLIEMDDPRLIVAWEISKRRWPALCRCKEWVAELAFELSCAEDFELPDGSFDPYWVGYCVYSYWVHSTTLRNWDSANCRKRMGVPPYIPDLWDDTAGPRLN
jgi:hypothetical protein